MLLEAIPWNISASEISRYTVYLITFVREVTSVASKHVLYADSEHSLVLSKHSRSYEKTSASELIVLFIIRNTAIDHVMVTSPNPASHVLILILTCGYKDNCMYVTYVVGTGIGIMINPQS